MKLFLNLTPKERIIQFLRLFATCSVIAYGVSCLAVPWFTTSTYIARINCARLDVSYGLYKSLRNSVSQGPNPVDKTAAAGFPVDSSLTNLEILILTSYAEEQVANAPQYIITSLWSWCYGNYNTTKWEDSKGNTHYSKHDDTLICSKTSNNGNIFNYRQELETVGLQSILAYAFKSTSYDNLEYGELVKKRDLRYKLCPASIIFTVVSQFILLLGTIVLYSARGPERDLSKVSMIVLNAMALLAVGSAISITVGALVVTRMLIQIREEIALNLGDFGVSLHFGTAWFTLLWLTQAFSMLTMFSWAFPLWCANPEPFEEEDEFVFRTKRRVSSYVPQEYTVDTEMTDLEESKLNRFKRSLHLRNKSEALSTSPPSSPTHHHRISGLFQHHRPLSYEEKDEQELRKLGETLSRKVSVRRMNTKLSKQTVSNPFVIEEEETKDLLYGDNRDHNAYPDFPHHYREETYDGYGEEKRSRANTVDSTDAHRKERVFRHSSTTTPKTVTPVEILDTDRHSYLNEDEANFLDNNNFINKF